MSAATGERVYQMQTSKNYTEDADDGPEVEIEEQQQRLNKLEQDIGELATEHVKLQQKYDALARKREAFEEEQEIQKNAGASHRKSTAELALQDDEKEWLKNRVMEKLETFQEQYKEEHGGLEEEIRRSTTMTWQQLKMMHDNLTQQLKTIGDEDDAGENDVKGNIKKQSQGVEQKLEQVQNNLKIMEEHLKSLEQDEIYSYRNAADQGTSSAKGRPHHEDAHGDSIPVRGAPSEKSTKISMMQSQGAASKNDVETIKLRDCEGMPFAHVPDRVDVQKSYYYALIIQFSRPDAFQKASALFLFVVCAGVQICLCWTLARAISGPHINDALVERFREWSSSDDEFWGGKVCADGPDGQRVTVACVACHIQGSENTRIWSWQAETLQAYFTLIKPLDLGFGGELPSCLVFSFCACLMLAAFMTKEVLALLKFSSLLTVRPAQPWYSGMNCYKYSAKRNRGEIHRMSKLAKIMTSLVILVRVIVLVNLGIWGMRLIGHSIELADLILDCCLLVFILHFDRVFLATFSTPEVQHAVRTLHLPRDNDNLRPLVQYPVITCAVASAFAMLAVYTFTSKQVELSEDMENICRSSCSMGCSTSTALTS